MQEEVHPHNVWKVSNGDRTILRVEGGYNGLQKTFANKVFYQGKHVVEVKLDVYEEKGYQFIVGTCFEPIVHEVKDGDFRIVMVRCLQHMMMDVISTQKTSHHQMYLSPF